MYDNTVICVAPGPSLTIEDYRASMGSGYKIIAVNNAVLMSERSGRVISYSADLSWWEIYYEMVSKFAFELWSCSEESVRRFSLCRHKGIPGGFNSGQQAIHLAACFGAKRIIIIGYDCSLKNGLHYHGSHLHSLSNPTEGSVIAWQKHFNKTLPYLNGIDIINCSRYTELTCFRCGELNSVLKNKVNHFY